MAEGFIVVEQDEETLAPAAFWSGTVLQEDMQLSLLLPTRQDARLVAGQLQSAYPEREIAIVPARTAVELTAPARPVGVLAR